MLLNQFGGRTLGQWFPDVVLVLMLAVTKRDLTINSLKESGVGLTTE